MERRKWIICASGPSMLRVDLGHLRRFRSWNVIAVNNTWELVPWADVLYAGDLQWWERYGARLQDFPGERWTCDAFAAHRYGLRRVKGIEGYGLCRAPGQVHTGGNSGYQAVNLAWHFGAREIVLLGFDMHREAGGHWHGEHEGMLSAPPSHIAVWINRFEALAEDLRAEGVRVVNATPGSALEWFPRLPLATALRGRPQARHEDRPGGQARARREPARRRGAELVPDGSRGAAPVRT